MKSIFSFLKKWSLALGVLCGVYVGYGHVASWLQLKRAPVPWSAQFATEPNAITRFKYDGSPAIKFAPTNVAVEMGYAGDAPSNEQALGLFSGPARRLESGVARLRFRFKGTNVDGKERVVVGFRAESTRRKILVAMPRGDAALFLWGDEKGARPDVDMPSTMETFPGPFLEWHDDEWHELALRFDAARPSFIALVDGTPVASRLTDWRAGTEVSPVFGLFVDKDGRKATVELGEAGWEPTPENRPVIGFDFLEEFRGPAVNVHRWHTDVANDWWIKGNVLKISSGAGLRLESQTLTTATQELLTPVELCLNPLELTPIRVRSRWKLETLSFSSLYIGIYNINRNRIAEAVIRAEEPGTERMELRAHMHDAFRPEEIALSPLPKNELRSYEVELRYDPWFRTATVSLDGVALTRNRLDLRRGEFVRVCVGQRLAPSGVAAAVLESVEVHAAAY